MNRKPMGFVSWTRKPGDPTGTSKHPPSKTHARCCLQKRGNGLHNHPFGLCTGPRHQRISRTAFSASHAHGDTRCRSVPQLALLTTSPPVAKALICSGTRFLLYSSTINDCRGVTSSTSGVCAAPSPSWHVHVVCLDV